MMGVIIVIIILVLFLVLKMTKKYHITWYWCQDIRDSYMMEKRTEKFGQCPKENGFFPGRRSLALDVMSSHIFVNSFRTLELRCQIISGITELPTWYNMEIIFHCVVPQRQKMSVRLFRKGWIEVSAHAVYENSAVASHHTVKMEAWKLAHCCTIFLWDLGYEI